MIEIMRSILANVLKALYQPFGVVVIMTVLFMCSYMFARDIGCKTMVRQWLQSFKTDVNFRRVFFLTFYTNMILFRTLLNRNMWLNPVSNVIGVWGLYNDKGELTTEIIENLVLFVPFTILLLWSFQKKILGEIVRLLNVLWKSIAIVFIFSLAIEFLQLFLRLGTFQLSDLFYNTLGGLLGGLIYWVGYKINSRMKKGKEE